MGQLPSAVLLLIIFSSMDYASVWSNGKSTTGSGCVVKERKALLKFRESLSDPSNRLSSWNGSDCCSWKGITCDDITSRVIMLDLNNWPYPGHYPRHDTKLTGKMIDSSLLELKYLSYLDLSYNNFRLSRIPAFIGSMKQLHYLDLSHANFSGGVPHNLGNLSSLRVLDLGVAGLEVDDLMWASNLTSLELLDLSGANLSRIKHLAKVLKMLPSLTMLSLTDCGIDDTNIPLPYFFQNMTSLEALVLSTNAFSGHIPSSLSNLTDLRRLDVSLNQLHGHIPVSLGELSNIESIDISSNSLDGTISEAHFAKLSKLKYFLAESNTFTKLNFVVKSDWVPPFQLNHLSLKSIKIGGQFPQWLQTQKHLTYLDLSDCGISGNLPEHLDYFNVTGLFLSENHITGLIPHSLCEMKKLQILDLSKNHLLGNLPDCWAKLQELSLLRLSSNELSGIIPNSFEESHSLTWLQLNNNSLTGQLPYTLKSCTNLVVLDVGDNELWGKLPEWIGLDLFNLEVLRLRNNEFHDIISPAFCQLSNIHIMDLANNKLMGRIPHCLGNLSRSISKGWSFVDPYWSLSQVIKGLEREYGDTELQLWFNLDLSNNNLVGEIPSELTNFSPLVNLNLSYNHLKGKIPSRIGDLKSLQSLDFSSNHLLGTIPESLSNLNFLSHLNLSHNNLSGKIPTGNQLQTLEDPSIYDSNPGLCGPPLLKKCPDEGSSKSPNTENKGEANEGDRVEKIYFYGVVASGFATGFWGFIGVLVFKRSWRQAYFNFLELTIGKMLGLQAVYVYKLTRTKLCGIFVMSF